MNPQLAHARSAGYNYPAMPVMPPGIALAPQMLPGAANPYSQ